MRSASILILLLLVSCATPPRPEVADPEARFAARRAQLTDQDQWRLAGHVAVQLGDEGWHAGLRWQQYTERFDIDLLDPLGRMAAQLEGGPRTASIVTSKGETAHAADAESLMVDLLGWGVPLEGLRYWVLGVPEPNGAPAQVELDAYGRLAELRQAGWLIDYQDYQDVSGLELPEKLRLSNRGLTVKLIVDEWELTALK